MAFAIKVEVCDPRAKTFTFTAQKTMYGGKHIAEGDTVFVFASENEGGQGLVAASSPLVRRPQRRAASPGKHRAWASSSSAPRARSGRWVGASSNLSPTGMTANP